MDDRRRDVLHPAATVSGSSKEANDIANGIPLSKDTPRSAIFYGPPGTSKTSLAKEIAGYLSWPLLTVDPSYFVRNGLDGIYGQSDTLFAMLGEAEQIVVLFDEFEEMVRGRGSSEVLSRFLTTSMLPKLARLRDRRCIVFIVATNYIGNLDAAISRDGRFDMILPVLPPKTQDKLKKWPKIKQILANYDLLTDELIRRDLQLLTYGECVRAEQDLCKSNTGLDLQRRLTKWVKQCARVRGGSPGPRPDVQWRGRHHCESRQCGEYGRLRARHERLW